MSDQDDWLRGLLAKLAQERPELLRQALEAAGLRVAEHSANVTDVTSAQLERRGRAISRAKNIEGKDPRRIAMSKSKWGSLRKYAKRAGVSPASLVDYLDGKTACPRRIALMFEKDFGYPPTEATWPRGIVD